jgi:deazaflavin-dependent oxidoreductase (nitroreductase family)
MTAVAPGIEQVQSNADRPLGNSLVRPVCESIGDLPYGPLLSRGLGPLQKVFGPFNRWVVAPAVRAGLGPLFSTPLTGSMMLLRTTGRRSGLPREAPLGYVISDGSVYCCAGFGRRTAWYRNLVADPRVEAILPTSAIAGLAETVTDPTEWSRVFPAYVRALGLIGRLTLGDVGTADEERLAAIRAQLPLVRIRPTGLASGPADPGGGLWIVVQTLAAVVVIRSAIWAGRRIRRARKS